MHIVQNIIVSPITIRAKNSVGPKSSATAASGKAATIRTMSLNESPNVDA